MTSLFLDEGLTCDGLNIIDAGRFLISFALGPDTLFLPLHVSLTASRHDLCTFHSHSANCKQCTKLTTTISTDFNKQLGVRTTSSSSSEQSFGFNCYSKCVQMHLSARLHQNLPVVLHNHNHIAEYGEQS